MLKCLLNIANITASRLNQNQSNQRNIFQLRLYHDLSLTDPLLDDLCRFTAYKLPSNKLAILEDTLVQNSDPPSDRPG